MIKHVPFHEAAQRHHLYVVVLVDEIDIPNTPAVVRYKVLITRRAFVLVICSQHTLDAHADALGSLHGRPA